jgi:hypothetical protein
MVFSTVQSGAPTRGLKLGGTSSGYVDDLTFCGTPVIQGYATSGTSCGATTYATALYAASDDPGFYENKRFWTSCGGSCYSFLTNGPWTLANSPTGPGAYTATIASGNGLITSVTCCTNNPVSNAGPDNSYSLPSPSITLNGSATDCDGTVTGLVWSQVSGPNSATIVPLSNSLSSISSSVTGVIAGTYTFRLTSTDNTGNTGTDDVVILVQPPPLCVGTTTKIPVTPPMCWDLNGVHGYGCVGYIGDTSKPTNRWGTWLGRAFTSFDGDFDPGNPVPNFDMDTTRPGFQNDTTVPIITRPTHNYFDGGSGAQWLMFIDLGKVYYIDKMYWNDTTGSNIPNAAEVIFTTSLEEVRQGVFQFDTRRGFGAPTIDFTLDCSATNGWKSRTNIRDSAQYILIRYNDVNLHFGPAFSSFAFYGCPSPFNTKDTRITPDFSLPLIRDTTKSVGQVNSNFVIATGVAESDLVANIPQMEGMGGYVGKAGISDGLFDKDSNAVNVGGRSNTSTYRCDLAPYRDINIFKDSTFWNRPSKYAYVVDKALNAKLAHDINHDINEYIPIDSLGADPRLDSSYDRFWYVHCAFHAKVGSDIPDLTKGYAPFFRYSNDAFPGRWAWGRYRYTIGYNENWAGFRGSLAYPAGNYMSTYMLRAFEDKGRREFKTIFGNNAKFVGQGNAAWLMEGWLEATKLNQILYLDKSAILADVFNVHIIIATKMTYAVDGGSFTGYHSRGEFPGQRAEFLKGQSFIDTMYYITGVKQRMIITEMTVSSNKGFKMQEDPSGSLDGAISNHGARKVKGYDAYESQGIISNQMRHTYSRMGGLEANFIYEYRDAADTAQSFYNNSDANDGYHNAFQNFYKPGFYIWNEHTKWLKDYRVVLSQVDSLSGQMRIVYRNINSGKRDSFCTFVAWQDSTDAPSVRVIPLKSDVTQVTRLEHLWPDATFNGTTVATTVTSGNVTFTPKPEGDYVFFKSTNLATELDNTNASPTSAAGGDQAISLPANSVTVDGSSSFDPDGTISSYSWSKIAGPATFTIVSPTSASTDINNLIVGQYTFRLTVTDNLGATATDDVIITVSSVAAGAMKLKLRRNEGVFH